MKDFIKKLTSRKFLMALASAIVGIVTVFTGESDALTTVVGAAVTVISTVGYCITEGMVDAQSVRDISDAIVSIVDSDE